MKISRRRPSAAVLVFALLVLVSPLVALQQAPPAPDPPARPDLVRQPYSEADINFMAGMIPHHAQAVLIAGWARSHGARADIAALCERQVVAQRDEIAFMRNWLRDRGQFVPAADATHHRMKMNGVEHDMLMPGMLTPADLAQLDKARGPEWDRLFLTFMIKHHQGALKMVEELFASYGAMQDDDVYTLATDIQSDQEIEIERMQKLLEGMGQKESGRTNKNAGNWTGHVQPDAARGTKNRTGNEEPGTRNGANS